MPVYSKFLKTAKRLLLFLAVILSSINLSAQDWRFGIYTNPVVSWFKTDIEEVSNSGARTGFALSTTLERYLSGNWYFEGGISFMAASSRLKYSEPSFFRFPDHTSVIASGSTIVYRMQYLSFPAGIKIKTPPSGDYTYFGEFGLDPGIIIRSTADIPSIDIKSGIAKDETKRFNAGYHVNAGAEFQPRGNTTFVIGAGYQSNIFDTTKDNDGEFADRTIQKFIKIIFGVKF